MPATPEVEPSVPDPDLLRPVAFDPPESEAAPEAGPASSLESDGFLIEAAPDKLETQEQRRAWSYARWVTQLTGRSRSEIAALAAR